jgi:predicted PurR-regulated permease PerM
MIGLEAWGDGNRFRASPSHKVPRQRANHYNPTLLAGGCRLKQVHRSYQPTQRILPEMTDLRPPDPAAHVAVAVRRPLPYRHYLWGIGAALIVFFALRWLGAVLTPFLVGAILAYLGTPVVHALQRRGVPRAIATTFTVLLFGLVLICVFIVLIPLIQGEVALAAKRLPTLMMEATAQVAPWLEQRFGITTALDFDTLKTFLTENAESAHALSLRLLSGVKAGSLIALSILINLALIPVVMFYLLRDWKMIGQRLEDLVPRDWQGRYRTIVREIDGVLAEFLRGQFSVMVVLAFYYAIGLTLAGLDRALAIGVLTGLLVFIPYVGFGLGFVLGVVAALLQWTGWPAFIAVLAVYGIGQLLENYVLVPWLVGDRIGLHPIAVIFALLAFGQLFGFAGVLLALPLSAALLVGLRHLRSEYVLSPFYIGDSEGDG